MVTRRRASGRDRGAVPHRLTAGTPPMRFVLGFVLSAVIAAIAWRRGSLSRSGAIAAVVVGTLVFGCGGPDGARCRARSGCSQRQLAHRAMRRLPAAER